MVNTNIQGPIPFIGRGQVNKPNGGWEPGELAQCTNMEIMDGQLVTRRPVQYCRADSVAGIDKGFVYENSQPFGIIGEYNGIVNGVQSQAAIISGANTGNGFTRLVPGGDVQSYIFADVYTMFPVAGYSYRELCGFFNYNGLNYYLVEELVTATNNHQIRLFSQTTANLGTATVVDEGIVVNNGSMALAVPENFKYRSHFIYKERLWIVTNNGVYFSAATDPTDFTLPLGGFIRSESASRYCAVPHRDSIYIGTNLSLGVFTYTVDPNADGSQRIISNTSCLSLCINKDVIFGINKDEFFEVSNNTVNTIFPLDDLYAFYHIDIQLIPADNNILFIQKPQEVGSQRINTNLLLPYFVVFNIEHSFINFFDIRALSSGVTTEPLCVFEALYMDETDITVFIAFDVINNKTSCFFMMGSNKYTYNVSSFLPSPFRGLDVFHNTVATLRTVPIFVTLDLRQFSPDGHEYLMKKFRSLLIEGQFSYDNLNLYIAYDDQPYLTPISLVNAHNADAYYNRPPFPIRIGLNQRARSINIRFASALPIGQEIVAADESQYQFLAVRDMRVLYAYTERAVGDRIPPRANVIP